MALRTPQLREEDGWMRNSKAEQKLAAIRASTAPYELSRGGLNLTVLEGVYPTSELSEMFLDVMDDPILGIHRGDEVLDYGSGTGFLAIHAAQRGARVLAIDVNEAAIECGRLNAGRYQVQPAIDFRRGENLDRVEPGERFDVIVAGMPWDDAQPRDITERALYDPNFQMRRALYGGAARLLKRGGRIFISSSEEHERRYPDLRAGWDLHFEMVRQRPINGVMHYVIMLLPI